jgi:type I restriction-modification system DNA methylase subunit
VKRCIVNKKYLTVAVPDRWGQPLFQFNPNAKLEVFGQEINPESYAICKSDMLIKGRIDNG